MIGPNVHVMEGAQVTDATLRDCVVFPDATITGGTVERAIIGTGAELRGAEVESAMIGPELTVAEPLSSQ